MHFIIKTKIPIPNPSLFLVLPTTMALFLSPRKVWTICRGASNSSKAYVYQNIVSEIQNWSLYCKKAMKAT